MPIAYGTSRQCCLCLDSDCSSVDGNTQGKEEGKDVRVCVDVCRCVHVCDSRAVLIGTEDRGQEKEGKRNRGETGSPQALGWLTLPNDPSLS